MFSTSQNSRQAICAVCALSSEYAADGGLDRSCLCCFGDDNAALYHQRASNVENDMGTGSKGADVVVYIVVVCAVIV